MPFPSNFSLLFNSKIKIKGIHLYIQKKKFYIKIAEEKKAKKSLNKKSRLIFRAGRRAGARLGRTAQLAQLS